MRRMKYQGNDKASGSRTHDKDESQVLCYNCRKPGHFKSECPYPIVKKHQDEHNYKKNSGRYHHPKSNPNDVDEESSKIQKNDKRRKALAVEEKTGEKNEESCTSSSSSESDSSEDEKGLLCLFSQEDSDEEMCLMAEEEEVTSQNQSSNYSSESVCHENPREAFEKMMKSFYGIEDSHLKLKEENAKLLAERQDLEDLKSKNAEMLESISQLEKQVFANFLGESHHRDAIISLAGFIFNVRINNDVAFKPVRFFHKGAFEVFKPFDIPSTAFRTPNRPSVVPRRRHRLEFHRRGQPDARNLPNLAQKP
nr:uncharacterized protein LOC109163772 [Ipomoea trifida]